MSGDAGSLKAAQEKIQALLDAAKAGSIIPFRLPDQIEEIGHLLAKAEEEQVAAEKEAAANAAPTDIKTYMEEESYFVGHAVHELRTPMTSIRGYTDMLGAMGALSDMQKQFLDVVKVNARRMEGLLSDVSYINKIRKGTLKAQPKMDTFKNIALKIEKDLKAKSEDMKRELIMDIPQGLPLLNVDSDLLSLALVKLTENALQYTKPEVGKVTVSAEGEGNLLVIHISDNGIGISPEDMAKLGTMYFRSDHDHVREFKGSGLGIPIAYGLINLIGGTIDITSTLDEGTRFTIKIPGMT